MPTLNRGGKFSQAVLWTELGPPDSAPRVLFGVLVGVPVAILAQCVVGQAAK